MKARILVILGALSLAIGLGIGSGEAAHAASAAHQYCVSGAYCLNAWNGGPAVNVYSTGVQNNDFYAFYNSGTGYYNIAFIGGGTYDGDCVSDYGNSSSDARAGLDGNCQLGSIAWGANFMEDDNCGAGAVGFQNVHWGGWLAPAGNADGDAFYLNNGSEHCFSILGAG